MANTYTQIFVQLVFAVGERKRLISEADRPALEKYICGIVSSMDSKVLAVYCNPDHCHLLVSLNPKVSISDLAKTVKSKSSKWMNESSDRAERFHWQTGYGAFTYYRNRIPYVIDYIRNQHEHHRVKSFTEEYLDFLKSAGIEYDDRYLFQSLY